MKQIKLFFTAFVLLMSTMTTWALEETYTCALGTVVGETITYDLTSCTIVQDKEHATSFRARTPWEISQGSSITFTPKDGVAIEKIDIIASSSTMASNARRASWKNARAAASEEVCTLTASEGAQYIKGTATKAEFNCQSIVITYNIQKPTIVYTVAGEPAALFGTEWDVANTANNMTLQDDGTYKWEKKDVELTARDIEFKVVKDGNWNNAYPTDNVKYTIAKAGKYDVTITFNDVTKIPEINAVLISEIVTPEPEPKPTGEIYTVAGTPAKLFGTEWDPANKDNIMEFLEDGTYKWEKKDVEMSATTVQFKVVKGSAWGTEYPSSNYELKIAKSGKYTITITFDPNGNKVAATATLQEEVEVIPSIAIAGDMNEWNTTANTFTMAEDKKTASLALNLEAKDYGFKMIIGGSWTNDGQVITRENNSAVYTGANVDTNGTLTADVAGEYTFTWTYATNTLTITFPAKSTVGFENVEATENAVKFIENGKLYIIREGNVYDAIGARVK